MNYSWRLHELEELRESDRPLVDLGCDLAEKQMDEDRLFLGETPLRSAIWDEPRVVRLRNRPDVIEVECDAGAYGAETVTGEPIAKPHRFITNSPILARLLSLKLTPEQKMYTTKVEGRHTKASGQYCHGLACAILEGLREEARLRNPQRFQLNHEVYYAAPTTHEEDWTAALNEAEKRFENTSKRPLILAEGDILYQQVQELVPWKLNRIQLAWLPGQRRWPTEVPFTHRGCAYRDASGRFAIEHEDLTSVPYPKQKFINPVRVAIFFYGEAPEEPAERLQFDDDREIPTTAKVAGLNTDIHFEGGPPMSREMRSSLARLHCNLGHAPKTEIIRILAAAGKLDSKILAGLDALRCGTCKRLTKPTKPPTSSTASASRYAGAFGEHLQADIIYIRLLDGYACPVLGMVCMSTNYHAAKTLQNRSPEHLLEVMQEIWYRPLGLPISITVDSDTAFYGVNEQWHQQIGVEFDIIPAEEAHKLGKIGRRNALMRTLSERLIDQNGATNKDQLNNILTAVLHSMNNSTYSYGRSPCQAVFGRMPRPVGDLLSDEKALAITPPLEGAQLSLRPELLRAEAVTALAQFSASQAIRRALLRKTRNQKDFSHLEPGQAIAFWRQSAKARQHKRGAWCLGRFLALDPDRKSMWVQVGKNSIRIGNTQVREAAGWETWTPTSDDLNFIRQAENNIAQGLWSDEVEDGPREEDAADIEADIFQFRRQFPQRLEDEPDVPMIDTPGPPPQQTILNQEQHMPHSMADVPQSIPPGERVQDAIQQLPTPLQHPMQPRYDTHLPISQHYEQSTQQQQYLQQNFQQNYQNININSPTYQNFGPRADFGMNPPTPRTARARSRTPTRTGFQPEQRPATAVPQTTLPIEQQPQTSTAEASLPLQGPEQAFCVLGSEQAHCAYGPEQAPCAKGSEQAFCVKGPEQAFSVPGPEQAYMSNFETMDDGSIHQRLHGWDGSPDFASPAMPSQRAYNAYLASDQRKVEMMNAGISKDVERADNSSSDEDLSISNDRNLTRQEMKQLDRELPWREVWALPTMIREKYIEAAVNEYNGWLQWNSIRPLTQAEANEIYKDPKLRRRILRSRSAYRDKSRGIGEIKAKCRVVLIGCQDPDLHSLSRDSPTPTRLSEYILMSVASAGANRMFNGDGRRWSIWISDAEKAFLQGTQDSSERKGLPLYMAPPQDAIIQAAEAFPAPLYEVTSNACGLANAPRVWYKRVDKVVRGCDFKQHSFDRCLYYHVGEDGLLDALMIVHVDDMLAVYSETFPLELLEGMFKWGSMTKITHDTPGEFRGKEIQMIVEDNKVSYKVTQKSFIKNLAPGNLRVGRLRQPPELSDEERKEFRSVCGCLQWLGGQTRPELCAATSLAHRGADTDIHDLKHLYECIAFAKQTADCGLTFPPIFLNRASTLVTYSDSSWANARCHKSQYGVVVTITSAQVTETTCHAHILDWKSGRSPRVCRSTLASEACACDEASDRACFANLVLSELLYQKAAYLGDLKLNSLLCTDAKSLYDCLVAENPAVTDKRSMVQIRAVQQNHAPAAIRWIPTKLQTD